MPRKSKPKGVRWLRRWHAAILRECGTDDLCVIVGRYKMATRNLAVTLDGATLFQTTIEQAHWHNELRGA